MARGRSGGTASLHATMSTSRPSWRCAAALGALFLAACSQIETPVATVSGRIVGAGGGGRAYAFGRPDLATATLADGSFVLEGVPTSVEAIVLLDGVDRAERVAVTLSGGENRLADRYGSGATVDEALRMPLAAILLVTSVPEGGADPAGTAYTVLGTDVEGRVHSSGSGAAVLGQLPAGSLEVRADLGGFVGQSLPVDALAGATATLAIPLPIDLSDPAPGCNGTMACANQLHCNPGDGRCYACTSTGDCAPGEICTPSRLCQPASGPAARICSACADDAGCDMAAGLRCRKPEGSPGYCTRTCSVESDCPAGFTCENSKCAAPEGCAAWMQTMGAPCLESDQCDSHLDRGRCQAPSGPPGYCSAPCTVTADCQIGQGPASTMVCTGGWCALP